MRIKIVAIKKTGDYDYVLLKKTEIYNIENNYLKY